MMNALLETLTDFEVMGLHNPICLADGHAYHDLHPAYNKIIHTLPEIWHQAAAQSIPEAESAFNTAYATLIQAPILKTFKNFRICPTASNSIDLVGAVLHHLRSKVIMIEPTFDNLSLLLKRRGVSLHAVSDAALFAAAEANDLDAQLPYLKTFDTLFIVHPNNPTGLTLSEQAFKNILAFCQTHHLMLVIDHCFRLHHRNTFQDYELLINSGVSFIAFEDTGKVWPTQDMKASLIYFSEDIAALFNQLYNEVYLCVSNLSLGILSAFLEVTTAVGIDETIWRIVDERRAMVRAALEGTSFSIPALSQHSSLPVEWIQCDMAMKDDFMICNELKSLNLFVLPGRQFYWNSVDAPHHHQNIRVSLMKREAVFLQGLPILQKYCQASQFYEVVSCALAHGEAVC